MKLKLSNKVVSKDLRWFFEGISLLVTPKDVFHSVLGTLDPKYVSN